MNKETAHLNTFVRQTVKKGDQNHRVENGEKDAIVDFTQDLIDSIRSQKANPQQKIIIKALRTAQQEHLIKVAEFLAKNTAKSIAR